MLLSALSCGASLWLAACASPQRRLDARAEHYWLGRLSLNTQEERSRGFSAGFELSGQPQQGVLVLNSPLGSQLAQVHWSAEQAVLQQGHSSQRFASLEVLIQQLTGTALPVPALFDWLAGIPTPVEGWQVDLSRLSEGRLQALRQSPAPVTSLKVVLEP
jgi:outer membrane lipoprotein LolB